MAVLDVDQSHTPGFSNSMSVQLDDGRGSEDGEILEHAQNLPPARHGDSHPATPAFMPLLGNESIVGSQQAQGNGIDGMHRSSNGRPLSHEDGTKGQRFSSTLSNAGSSQHSAMTKPIDIPRSTVEKTISDAHQVVQDTKQLERFQAQKDKDFKERERLFREHQTAKREALEQKLKEERLQFHRQIEQERASQLAYESDNEARNISPKASRPNAVDQSSASIGSPLPSITNASIDGDKSSRSSTSSQGTRFSPDFVKDYRLRATFRQTDHNTFELTIPGDWPAANREESASPDSGNQSSHREPDPSLKHLLEALILEKLNSSADGTEFHNISTKFNENSMRMRKGGFGWVIHCVWAGKHKPTIPAEDGLATHYIGTPWGWLEVKLRPFCIIRWNENKVEGVLGYTYKDRAWNQLSTFLQGDSIPLQQVHAGDPGTAMSDRKDGQVRVVGYDHKGPTYLSKSITRLDMTHPMSFKSGLIVEADREILMDYLANNLETTRDEFVSGAISPPQPCELRKECKERER